MKSSKICLFGAGNVAINIAKALNLAGYRIIQVYSRTLESAAQLTNRLDASPITDPSHFDHSADVVIFALNDNALSEVISKIDFSGQLALHTSGSTSIDVFKDKAEHYGVLYPLQTFSKNRAVKFHEIPLFIEANSSKNLSNLKMLASSLAANVFVADSIQRKQLHLSAVFANNFVNHLYTLASEMIKTSGFTFEVLKPIILETALKAIDSNNPGTVQTGPAIRLNKEIIEKHIEMLTLRPDLQNLYTFTTNSIVKTHHNSNII